MLDVGVDGEMVLDADCRNFYLCLLSGAAVVRDICIPNALPPTLPGEGFYVRHCVRQLDVAGLW